MKFGGNQSTLRLSLPCISQKVERSSPCSRVPKEKPGKVDLLHLLKSPGKKIKHPVAIPFRTNRGIKTYSSPSGSSHMPGTCLLGTTGIRNLRYTQRAGDYLPNVSFFCGGQSRFRASAAKPASHAHCREDNTCVHMASGPRSCPCGFPETLPCPVRTQTNTREGPARERIDTLGNWIGTLSDPLPFGRKPIAPA